MMAFHGCRICEWLRERFLRDARWWQFWLPQAGLVGGFISAIIIAVLIAIIILGFVLARPGVYGTLGVPPPTDYGRTN